MVGLAMYLSPSSPVVVGFKNTATKFEGWQTLFQKADIAFSPLPGNKATQYYNFYSDMYFYPLIVFDVDTSSFVNKVAQNFFNTSFFGCQVQGSLLMENKVPEWIACIG